MSATSLKSDDRRRSARVASKRPVQEEASPSQVKRRRVSSKKDDGLGQLPAVTTATEGLVPMVVIDAPQLAETLAEVDGQEHEINAMQTEHAPSAADVSKTAANTSTKKQPREKKGKNKSTTSDAALLGANGEEQEENAQEEGLAADTEMVPSALDIMSSKTKPITDRSKPVSTKSSHVRFGSEEPQTVSTLASTAPAPQQAGDETEEDSEDDAPEDITVSAAQAQTKALAADQAKAIAEQRANTKRKRRDAAERLREQATTSKSKQFRNQKKTNTTSSDTEDEAEEAAVAKSFSRADDLPEFLPAELLERRTAASPSPSPPPSSKGQSKSLKTTSSLSATKATQSKGRLIKFDVSPPDVRVGPVSVHVLHAANPRLPARGDGKGASVRKAWLSGRAGAGVQRQKIGKGFLRS